VVNSVGAALMGQNARRLAGGGQEGVGEGSAGFARPGPEGSKKSWQILPGAA
jgi:hypothetical protein